jgi:hypothetical protein
VGEYLSALALCIMFGLGFVAGRNSTRRVVVVGRRGCQVVVVPNDQRPVTVTNKQEANRGE